MEKNISLSAPLKRIKVLDALRGFALLGVILMHMIQHFGIRSLPSENGVFEFPVWDETIRWIGNNIIMGRFINIFAFLFGLSFFIQIVQIVCSKYWLKQFLYGPLEWLWRSGTYLKLQPFKKK